MFCLLLNFISKELPVYMSIKKNKNLICREINGETLILNTINNAVCSLNSTGAFLWKLLDTVTIREHLVTQMVHNFSIEKSVAQRDVDEFCEKMKSNQLIYEEEN